MVKIAVEEPFVSVKNALEKKGYTAEMLEKKTDSVDYDCVVVRDQEDLTDFHMNVPLVEAKGRTLAEIVEEVEERLVRSGKIQAPASTDDGKSGNPFLKGVATGAIVGAAAGLLLTPKSGKEMQAVVKEKTSGSTQKVSETAAKTKEKLTGTLDQVKEKAGQAKEKATDVTDKTKGKVDEIKAKRDEKKEEKELKKQEKTVIKEAKAEEKAKKEHEKAEKQVEKEVKKAEKEANEGSGKIRVDEMGDADIVTNSSGGAAITPKDKDKK